MSTSPIYSLTDVAKEDFDPAYAPNFFRVVGSRTHGRRLIRAVALRADGSSDWLDSRTFEVDASDLQVVE